MFENPTNASRRIGELNRAEQGAIEMQAYPAYGIPERRAEPETPLLTAEQARARIKEEGLDLTVEDSGIRAGALDILIERKREEVKRKLILDNAPASTIPVQLLAGFGASVLDPINKSEEHTSELQSLMRISYAVFCLKNKNKNNTATYQNLFQRQL